MCQLLGLNCNAPTDVSFSFSGFALRSGVTDNHADGWGIAFFDGTEEDRGVRYFLDHLPACQSPLAELVRQYPIKSRQVIAHIRKATRGPVALENTHPFVRELWGRYWVFAHNGNLENYQPALKGPFEAVGDTDSELAFCWILQEMNKAHPRMPSLDELSQTLKALAAQVAAYGPFNFLLSNGQALWAHASTNLWFLERSHPFSHAKLSDQDLSIDFSKYAKPDDRVAVVVTAPLTENESWTRFEPSELRLFTNGASRRIEARQRAVVSARPGGQYPAAS